MPSLLFCETPTPAEALRRELGIPEGCIRGSDGREPRQLSARYPYLLGALHDGSQRGICRVLEPHGPMLGGMTSDFGGPVTLALSDIASDLRNYGATGLAGLGAGADLTSSRIGRLLAAMREHQANMLAYHRVTRKGLRADAQAIEAARSELGRSGTQLNQRFAYELEVSSRRLRHRERSLMSDRRDMPELVQRTRKAARLDVASQIEAGKLADLARNTRRIGRAAVLVDLGVSAKEVYDEVQSGGDWQRKAVTEGSGFAAGVAAGYLLTGAALETLEVIALASPAGWILLIGGLAMAGIITAGSQIAGLASAQVTERAYDALKAMPRMP